LRPTFQASGGTDGWVSLEVSPLLANNTAHTIKAAGRLFRQADRPNLFVKIPGTPDSLRAVEDVTVDGVPVNVTLLFSREHYLAAANAYMRGLERRQADGLDLKVASVASIFVSRWDVAIQPEIPAAFHNRLGIAMAMRVYRAHRELIASDRWQQLALAGAMPQRVLWASTGTKDPAVPDTLYVQALVASGTINTLPEKTLLAYADHGRLGSPMPADGGYADAVLEEFRREGVDDAALALRLQGDGLASFATAWHEMQARIAEKSLQ
jgi:transaldolase